MTPARLTEGAGASISPGADLRHEPNTRSPAATRCLAIDVSDDDRRCRRRRKARIVKCHEILPLDPADALDGALRRTPIWMLVGIQRREQAHASPWPRGCLRPAEWRSGPRPFACRFHCAGNAGCITISPISSSIASKSSERHVQLTVITWRFAPTVSDTPASSSASAISIAGRLPGAAVEHARCEMAEADERVRVVDAAGPHPDMDGHGGNGMRLLRDDDRAVVEHVAGRRQPFLHSDRHVSAPSVGLNQPTVRRSRSQVLLRDTFDLVSRHGCDAASARPGTHPGWRPSGSTRADGRDS